MFAKHTPPGDRGTAGAGGKRRRCSGKPGGGRLQGLEARNLLLERGNRAVLLLEPGDGCGYFSLLHLPALADRRVDLHTELGQRLLFLLGEGAHLPA
jgi:hypothetical protein